MVIQENMTNVTKKSKVINYDQLSALGHKKRWAKRLDIIEKLREFGGIQTNYRKWSTSQLETLLKIWQKMEK